MGRARRRAQAARERPVADRRRAHARSTRSTEADVNADALDRPRASTRSRTWPSSTPSSPSRSRCCKARRRSCRTPRTRSPATSTTPSSIPSGCAQLDERLSAWIGLARRYRRPPAELPALLAQWQERAGARSTPPPTSTRSQRASRRGARAYDGEARASSAARRAAAPKFAAAVTQAMQQLGMAGGRFEVALEATEAPQSFGLESAEFLVAGHAGSTPRPLAKVASGGELSRIALAIAVDDQRARSAAAEAPGTLIFDEVDAGVGGAVAETVGRLMKQLGRERQVLAVTHLPQVAACADHHFVVSKRARDGTRTARRAVTGEARVAEIARMLGGERLSARASRMPRKCSLGAADAAPPKGRAMTRPQRGRPLPLGERAQTVMSNPVRRSRRRASRAARGRARHRNLGLGQVGRAACTRRRRLLLRRQPAARAAARLPAPRTASAAIAASPSRSTCAAPARCRTCCRCSSSCAAKASRVQASSSMPAPTRWCGASPRRAPAPSAAAEPRARAGRGDRARARAARRPARGLDRDRHQPAAPGAAARLDARAGRRRRSRLTLVFESFAFKHGVPLDADYVFDVRVLPNPHYIRELRPLTGRDAPVATTCAAQPEVGEMLAQIEAFLRALAAGVRRRPAQLPDGGDRLHRRPAPLGLFRRAAGRALSRAVPRR